MKFTDILTLILGLSLFLFGMQTMGQSLEKCAGGKLSGVVGRLTTGKLAGFLTGLGVTAVIQSSSATTVMVVGFVNSGLMTLGQAINVIMGANVGTTVTAWILSLTGISSSNPFVAMLKPANFTPILSLVGIVLLMSGKSDRKKDVGTIFLGFATLMFGMETMSGAVSGLKEVPEFQNILLTFRNPILGVAAGAFLTAVIQSSSASVGILQALSSTGRVTVGISIPIIMGQNIGTCVTAMLSAVGANKNAKRAAVVHLSFNVIGCLLCLLVYWGAVSVFDFAVLEASATAFSIALTHSVFNVVCTALMLPLSKLLEKLAFALVPGDQTAEPKTLLDERLLATPAFAIDRCRAMSVEMAGAALDCIQESLALLDNYTAEGAAQVRRLEDATDQYEDTLGSYLVKLSARPMSLHDSRQATEILHMIGDFERIADHGVNIVESAEEMRERDQSFSVQAKQELAVLMDAVREITDLACSAYIQQDGAQAREIEPLEQVVDGLKERIRTRHILRLQAGGCSLEMGFILSDVLTQLERVADHCSNIAGCLIEMEHDELDLHSYVDQIHTSGGDYQNAFESYLRRYPLPDPIKEG